MLETVRKAYALFEKRQKVKLAILALLSVFGALLEAGTVALVYPLMSMIVPSLSGSDGTVAVVLAFFKDTLGATITGLLFALAALYLLLGFWKLFCEYLSARWMAQIRTRLSARLFRQFLEKPYSYHLRHSTAEIQRVVTEDTTRSMTLVGSLMELASVALTGLSVCVTLAVMSPVITVILIVVSVTAVVSANKLLARTTQRISKANQEFNTKVNKWIYQTAGALKSILVNRKEQFFLRQYTQNARKAATQDAKYSVLNAVPKFIVQYGGMGLIFIALAAYSSGAQSIAGVLPTLATFAMAAMKLFPSFATASNCLTLINYRKANVDALYATLFPSGEPAAEAETRSLEEAEQCPPAGTLQEGILVKNISFSYADAQAPLYEDLTLSIPANRSVAFVGTTGSGKTTLADIILGLHQPAAGCVLVDGRDIAQNRSWWANQIGYIPQFIYLCDDAIRANVAFACDPQQIRDEDVWAALEEAQLKDFVESLPQKLDTVVGENGMRLSGGQRQRIGIARALYTNPSFLVMDEATSSLDNETEKAIIDSINRLAGQKTLLIIAHRLTTIQNCDIVYRIENGRATRER